MLGSHEEEPVDPAVSTVCRMRPSSPVLRDAKDAATPSETELPFSSPPTCVLTLRSAIASDYFQ